MQYASGLHQWLYVSRCQLPSRWVASAIDDIVEKSRARNAALGVTGALLFTGQRFAQFIEGPADNVAMLTTSIENDTRHAEVRTLRAGPLDASLFDAWSLAYAGPSLFVSRQVEAVLDDIAQSADRLIRVLQEFATSP